jgi:hypothetical protein
MSDDDDFSTLTETISEISVPTLSVYVDWGTVMARNNGDLQASVNEMRQLRTVLY